MTAPIETEEEKKSDVSEYLQAPRRKRKDYVILAISKKFSRDMYSNIEAFVKKTFPVQVARPKNDQELARLSSRQVVLVLIDDEFSSIEGNVGLVKQLKDKKGSETVPVLFLTDKEEKLITEYSKKLLLYQEIDNYISYRRMPLNHIYSRIAETMKLAKGARRSRRYKVEIGVDFQDLHSGKIHIGTLKDLSIHGGVIESDKERIFSVNEQLKIRVPLEGYLPESGQDFFRLSSKVRRVFMGGHRCGISWEHLNEHQFLTLTRFLTEIVSRQTANPRRA